MKINKLENGYYVSTYIEIDPIGNLFMYAQRHDQCLALWKFEDGYVELLHYLELERRSGIKHNHWDLFSVEQYNSLLIDILKEHGLSMSDIKETWGTPQLNENTDYLSVYNYPEVSYHAMCHISSSLFIDMNIFSNESILAFSIDGGSDNVLDEHADKRNQFICAHKRKSQNNIEFAPVYSPVPLWIFMREYSGMIEGSLMALASASSSEAYLQFDDILYMNSTEEANVQNDLMKIIHEVEALEKKDIGVKFNGYDKRFSEKDNKLSMIMKIVQKMSVSIMERNIDFMIEKFNIIPKDTYLGMAGGFALNCPTNTHLMNKYQFKGFIAPPCVSDTGMALGCGLFAFYQKTSGNFQFNLKTSFYGDKDNLQDFMKRDHEFKSYIASIDTFEAEMVVMDIMEDVIVWFNGRAEIGPRALGSRSLIADPRSNDSKDRLNEIKLRQWWRPVAPIINAKDVGKWFDEQFESPFMLHTFHIKKDKRNLVPAIIHEDGTARVQTVSSTDAVSEGEKLLSQVLIAFKNKTGIPILCNTSLNDRGEPIINNIEEALNFALRKGIRICYINGNRIKLHNHSEYSVKTPYPRPFKVEIWKNSEDRKRLLQEHNPLNLDLLTLFYCSVFRIDTSQVKDSTDIRILNHSAKLYLNSLPKSDKEKIIDDMNMVFSVNYSNLISKVTSY